MLDSSQEPVAITRLNQPSQYPRKSIPFQQGRKNLQWRAKQRVAMISLQQTHLVLSIYSCNLNRTAFSKSHWVAEFKKCISLPDLPIGSVFQGLMLPSFPLGKRKRRRQAAGDWNTILPGMWVLAIICVLSWPRSPGTFCNGRAKARLSWLVALWIPPAIKVKTMADFIPGVLHGF